MQKIEKKVSEYFKFMQDLLQKQYKGVKSPLQLKDDERKQFFNQVRKEWEAHKTSKKAWVHMEDQVKGLQTMVKVLTHMKEKGMLNPKELKLLTQREKDLELLTKEWQRLLQEAKNSED
jgi:uncharacterized HAD superfamily protein